MKAASLAIAITSTAIAASLVGFSIWRQSEQTIVRDLNDQTRYISESSLLPGVAVVDPELLELPHPGILPTHPLYPLKMIRDKLILATTTDPELKIKLHIHYAQKRLAASSALINDPSPSQAVKTLLRAHLYLTTSYELLKEYDPDYDHEVLWAELYKTAKLFDRLRNELSATIPSGIDLSNEHIESDIESGLNGFQNDPSSESSTSSAQPTTKNLDTTSIPYL